MPSVRRLAFAAIALIIAAAPFAHADDCVGAKLRAVGKAESRRLVCQARVAAQGDSSGLDACESNAMAKFSAAFAKAGTCMGDQMRCADMTDACVAAVTALLTEPFPSACEGAKRKAAAKLVKNELGCYVRAARKDDSVDLTCITRARDRFAVAVVKAGTCPDGGSPLSEVETQCVQPVVGIGSVNEVCPTTTTSTSTTTSTTLPFQCQDYGYRCGSCGSGYCVACYFSSVLRCVDGSEPSELPPCGTDQDCAPGKICAEVPVPYVCATVCLTPCP